MNPEQNPQNPQGQYPQGQSQPPMSQQPYPAQQPYQQPQQTPPPPVYKESTGQKIVRDAGLAMSLMAMITSFINMFRGLGGGSNSAKK